jgi:hypothetical protein
MIVKSPRKGPPPTRRAFASVWDEMLYVCGKAHYWLYVRQERSSAKRYLSRLGGLVKRVPRNSRAIIKAEASAILAELQGDIKLAAKWRRQEILLMKRLHEIAEKEMLHTKRRVRAGMLSGRGKRVLNERQRILARLKV